MIFCLRLNDNCAETSLKDYSWFFFFFLVYDNITWLKKTQILPSSYMEVMISKLKTHWFWMNMYIQFIGFINLLKMAIFFHSLFFFFFLKTNQHVIFIFLSVDHFQVEEISKLE